MENHVCKNHAHKEIAEVLGVHGAFLADLWMDATVAQKIVGSFSADLTVHHQHVDCLGVGPRIVQPENVPSFV